MDTKQLNQLDPKLKETYERIMGIKTMPSSSTKPVQPQGVQPPPSPSLKTSSPFSASVPQVAQPQQQPALQPSPPFPNQTQAAAVQPNTEPVTSQPISQSIQTTKKSNKLTRILLVVAGFIALLVYALVWIKILL